VNESEVKKGFSFNSDKVSGRVRDMSTAILAFAWLFIVQAATGTDGKTTGIGLRFVHPKLILPAIALSLLALLCDFGQYCFAYRAHEKLLATMQANGAAEGLFETDSWLYKAQKRLFPAKIALTGLATAWLIIVLLIHMF
jgi:hypothetical protein